MTTTCFECNKPRHLKKDYPLLKEKYKKMKKKKALYVGWEESKSSDSDEEQHETANLRTVDNICFMPHEDKLKSDSNEIIIFDELEDAYI